MYFFFFFGRLILNHCSLSQQFIYRNCKKKNIWKHWDLIVENFNKTLKFSIKIKWTVDRWQTLRVVSLNNYLNCSICYQMLTKVKCVKKNSGWIFFSKPYEFENVCYVIFLFVCLTCHWRNAIRSKVRLQMLHLFLTDRDVLLQTQVDNLKNQLDIVRGMFMNEILC